MCQSQCFDKVKCKSKDLNEVRGINEKHQAALHIDGGYVSQTVGRFAGNVFGIELVAVQAQHPHLGEVRHVDRTAEAAQRKLCKNARMQLLLACDCI